MPKDPYVIFFSKILLLLLVYINVRDLLNPRTLGRSTRPSSITLTHDAYPWAMILRVEQIVLKPTMQIIQHGWFVKVNPSIS